MRPLLILILLLPVMIGTGSSKPRAGEVLLVAGTGRACPEEFLSEEALVLQVDGAALPLPLAELATISISSTGPEPSRNECLRVRNAATLHLIGDRGLSMWRVMHLRGKRSALQQALLKGHAHGADLVGWRAGAEYLAGAWLVQAADLKAMGYRSRNPRRADRERYALAGLSLTPGGLVMVGDGPHIRSSMLAALHRRDAREGVILGGEVCWRWSPGTQRVEVLGEGQALLFEAGQSLRTKTGLRGATLSVLGEGDSWDLTEDRVQLASPRPGPSLDSPIDLEGLDATMRMARAPLRITGLGR